MDISSDEMEDFDFDNSAAITEDQLNVIKKSIERIKVALKKANDLQKAQKEPKNVQETKIKSNNASEIPKNVTTRQTLKPVIKSPNIPIIKNVKIIKPIMDEKSTSPRTANGPIILRKVDPKTLNLLRNLSKNKDISLKGPTKLMKSPAKSNTHSVKLTTIKTGQSPKETSRGNPEKKAIFTSTIALPENMKGPKVTTITSNKVDDSSKNPKISLVKMKDLQAKRKTKIIYDEMLLPAQRIASVMKSNAPGNKTPSKPKENKCPQDLPASKDELVGKCRLCLYKKHTRNKFYNIFNEKILNLTISSAIEDLTGLKIKESETSLPKEICQSCHGRVKAFAEFRSACVKTDCILRDVAHKRKPQKDQLAKNKPTENYEQPMIISNKKITEEEDPLDDNYDPCFQDEIEPLTINRPLDQKLVHYKFETNIEDMLDYLDSPKEKLQIDAKIEELIDENLDTIPEEFDSILHMAQKQLKKSNENNLLDHYYLKELDALKNFDYSKMAEYHLKVLKDVYEPKTELESEKNVIEPPRKRTKRVFCCGCTENFQLGEDLEKHRKNCHPEEEVPSGEYKCNLCNKRFNETPYSMERKVWKGHHNIDWDPRMCCACYSVFDSFDDLMKHTNEVHAPRNENPGSHLHECNICYGVFEAFSLLNKHRKSIYYMYSCSFCAMRCANAKSAQSHELNVHLSEKIKCPFCEDKSFRKQSSLDGHLIMKHDGMGYSGPIFECDLCNIKLSSHVTMKMHMRKSHLNIYANKHKFACTICSRIFNSNPTLRMHMKNHTQTKDLKCRYCDDSFIYYTDRQRHEIGKHTLEYLYNCEHCGKGFLRKDSCEKHRRICKG